MADTPDLNELMRMAQEMQKSMKEAHEDLSRQKYVGKAGDGLVQVIMNGRHDTLQVILDPKLKNEELEFIADLIAAANNSATLAIEEASAKKMDDLKNKLKLPGSKDEREE